MSTFRKRLTFTHMYSHRRLLPMSLAATSSGPAAPDPEMDLDIAREAMSRQGIDVAIASVQPQAHFGDVSEAGRWAGESNAYLARIVQDDPQHFGGFATLPLPDTQASLREMEYTLDVLKLDGILMLTSQGGHYLGDPLFEELYQELNRRKAVVVVHPNTFPPGADNLKLSLPYSMVEFTFDTTRTISNLLYSGTLERYPSIKFIMPHAGGTVPYLAWRIGLGAVLKPRLRERVPRGVMHYLHTSIFYDTALSTSDPSLSALRKFAPLSQIVFGSDFPFAPEPLVANQIAALDAFVADDPSARDAIYRGNAEALFPRFADAASTTATAVDPIRSAVRL